MLPDVLILGGGIVGAACADALARRGARVVLAEADIVGGGTTAAGMGHVVVMDDSPAQLALTAYSRSLWAAVAPEMGADCEDERRGTLWIAADDAEMDAVRAKHALYASHGLAARILDPRELAELEPQLRPGLAGALLVPDDAVLYPPAAARFLAERACARGAVVREGVAAESIDGGSVTLRERSGVRTRISAGVIVNAAGIDAPRLTPGLPVIPRKGHLVITERYPGLVRHQLVELGYLHSAHSMGGASTAFNVQPRATGQLLVGSSRELVGRDPSFNRAIAAQMMRRAIEFVPALARCAVVRAWTGFRPASADGLPLIGRWGHDDGIYVAAGHEGLGITMALGTAELIASMILGGVCGVDPAPFDPMRAPVAAHDEAAVA
jgi:glycine/D-amino acid oxidase-like deaminating enzyme